MVIDLEVSASTPSPTIDPSVRTILIGHSMGGIVAAEALLSITSDAPIPPATSPVSATQASRSPETSFSSKSSSNAFMFPYIQGILAFDTPYLGISPSVIAHGAETHYKTASTAYSTLAEVASVFGYGAASKSPPPSPSKQPKALPPSSESAKDAMAASMTAKNSDAAATPVWQRWGKYAMFAGAAGAVAAGGAAAYLKRDTITEGWSWVGSHLEFVGCLMRGEELKTRLDQIVRLQDEKGVGFRDLVTVLGKSAQGQSVAKGVLEINDFGGAAGERTFCTIPRSERNARVFERVLIEQATDEMGAHTSMFFPRENRGYYGMSERAKELVVRWVEEGWYEGSEEVDGKGGAMNTEAGLGEDEMVLVE